MAKKLRGKNAERLKKPQKKKMEKTLKRMNKIRKDDSIRLRTKIEERIKFHQAEVLKADNFIRESNQKIESVKVAKLRLEGAIISLQEILKNDTESNADNKV